MSSEVHKYIEETLKKNKNLPGAKLINFPKDKQIHKDEALKSNNDKFWKINDENNNDQLKAVIGLCFMFGTLIVIGLYSNLT